MSETSPKKFDTIKVNAKLKAEAEDIFEQIGMTSAEAVNIFFAKVVNTNGLPFSLKATKSKKETIDKLTAKPVPYLTEDYVDAKLKEAENEILSDIEPLDGFAIFKEFKKELSCKYVK
ncbi:MAG: type II toxin-antitoxin system RelB/DinJ family antitoxin [Clostridiales bacterium]|jgi:DNA-damage-inducible protein J|nr:type II toxin-antitoxin system RelB/DinJ family antitoxin [Clostridiales bacterium]